MGSLFRGSFAEGRGISLDIEISKPGKRKKERGIRTLRKE
jgi:hypothetical protein